MTSFRRLRRLLRSQRGFTLIELLTTTAILSLVVGGATTLFVGASNAQVELDRKIQAQLNARQGLERLRNDVHAATAVSSYATDRIVLTLPGGTSVRWCTRGSGTNWELYRLNGTTAGCAGGTKYAEYLTVKDAFTSYTKASGDLGLLKVELRVNLDTTKARRAYALIDELVLRNTTR